MSTEKDTLTAAARADSPATTGYASGETPMRGDVIYHHRLTEPVGAIALSQEEIQTWIVTSVVGDMVRSRLRRIRIRANAHTASIAALARSHGISAVYAKGLIDGAHRKDVL